MKRPVITKKQRMDGYLRSEVDFANWYVDDFMEENFKDLKFGIEDSVLKKWVINGRNYACHFGIKDRSDQVMFVTLMWEVGPDFFKFDGFRQIATNLNLSSEEKIKLFFNMDEDLAAEAIVNTDMNCWNSCDLPEMGVDNGQH